jgi:hypothetical protein
LVSAAEVINKESEETTLKKDKSKEPQKLVEKESKKKSEGLPPSG